MGTIREVDAISDAMTATDREIAGAAWDIEDTDPADETGDRALESMGDGLEGRHEAGEDADGEGSEEHDGDGETDGKGEGETGEAEAAANAGKTGEGEQPAPKPALTADGKIPPAVHRQLREERDAIRTERDGLKQEIETLKASGANKGEIDTLKTQVAALTQLLQGRQAPQQRTEPEPKAETPDIFENPKGFAEHLQQGFDTKIEGVLNTIRQNNVSNSFELAHVRHGEAFPKAMEAINKLNPQNPQDRQTVQSIYNSPNPGESLVRWHKQSEARSRVGDDIDAYETRIRNEEREALAKNPDFIKQVVASLRGEAATGENGSPRNQLRLPPSLKRAPGASSQSERPDHSASDDSEQSVADAAWR